MRYFLCGVHLHTRGSAAQLQHPVAAPTAFATRYPSLDKESKETFTMGTPHQYCPNCHYGSSVGKWPASGKCRILPHRRFHPTAIAGECEEAIMHNNIYLPVIQNVVTQNCQHQKN
jgi:hypothetical protein